MRGGVGSDVPGITKRGTDGEIRCEFIEFQMVNGVKERMVVKNVYKGDGLCRKEREIDPNLIKKLI